MNADEFFHVAEHLLTNGPNPEGRQRSALSRYYYSVFLEARDRLVKRGFKFKKHEAHDNVKKAFEWSNSKGLRTAGRLLGDLKKIRENADYEIATSLDSTQITEAQKLVSDIRETLATDDLSGCIDPRTR